MNVSSNETKPRKKKYGKRPTRRTVIPYKTILEDKAIQNYLAAHTKPPTEDKPNGYLSPMTVKHTGLAAYHFCTFLNIKVTNHSIYDLVQKKKKLRDKYTDLEDALRRYITSGTIVTRRNQAGVIIGIFHKNFAKLEITIHVGGSGKTKTKIPEPILRAIYNDPELAQEHRDAIDLQNYGAERRHATAMLELHKVTFIEGSQYCILEIPEHQSKTGVKHPSIIPRALAERLLDQAQRNNYKTLMPNYETIWNDITRLAKRKYNVKLTSHYFRTRFQQICEKIPSNIIPINEWMLYLGSLSTERNAMTGHLPLIYRADDYPEMIKRFETHLADELNLASNYSERISKAQNLILDKNQSIDQTQFDELNRKLDLIIRKFEAIS